MLDVPAVLYMLAALYVLAVLYVLALLYVLAVVPVLAMCSATAEGVAHELLPTPPLPLACCGVEVL